MGRVQERPPETHLDGSFTSRVVHIHLSSIQGGGPHHVFVSEDIS